MSDFLDDLDDLHLDEALKPFHIIAKKSDGEKLEWLKKVKDALLNASQPRTYRQRANLAMYRGIPINKWDRKRDYNSTRRLSKINKFIVNHLYDLTETKVSQMTRLKPAVEVLPTNDEWEDRASAKVVGLMIKHLWYINNVDFLIQRMHREARIFGEIFCFTLWDKSKGDLHPAYVEARDAGVEEIEIDGEMVSLDKPIKTGDVCYELEVPWRVLLQRKDRYEDVEYLIRIGVEETETLKVEHPDKKKEIEPDHDLKVFDIEEMEHKFVEGQTIVYEMYHKKTKHLSEGSYIKFTEKGILEQSDLPFTHGKLPIVRLTDLDVPEVLNGISRYETVANIQNMYNNLSTLIAKNIYLTAHAKWMMPRGAAKIESLGNDNTIVQFQGPVAPTLAQVQPNSPEVYAYREQLKQDMQTIYGSHGISRGEVPKGITAASALQFLNELENERSSTDISKHGFLVKDLAKMTMSVAADNYDVEDGRMVRIVGENNKFMIRQFDAANLSKSYDVRFDNSTGLPESKSAKIQRILDAMQRNPNLFSSERWEELLELGSTEKMANLSTSAIRSADSENEDMLAAVPVAPPEDWEDHLAHWDSHVNSMQSRSFKEEVTPEIMAVVKKHLFQTEQLMLEKSATSPLFQAKLAERKLFPIFYHEDMSIPTSAAHQEALVQGQANRGESVSGNIPGEDVEVSNDRRSQTTTGGSK